MFWSRWSKRISLARIWSKHRYFGRSGRNVSRLVELGQDIEFCGRAGRNVSRLVKLGRIWSKQKSFVRAGRNVSCLVEHSRNIEVVVVPIETYLTWSNLVETQVFLSLRSKRISLGQTWSNLVETEMLWSRRSKRISLG